MFVDLKKCLACTEKLPAYFMEGKGLHDYTCIQT